MTEKLSPEHLARAAYVYVRQSTAHQVLYHREGQQRQYALAERAKELGFAATVVIDEDLGRSGSGLQERPGFGRLLTAVCQGEVGAVVALEASRLARNNRDWHHLVDLCALTATLIIDDDGTYDPRQINDRLLLGLKGTMSEFELGLLRQRARAAFEQKAQRGHAMWEVPVGYVRTEDDRIEKIADRQVQQAIDGVFRKFRELGTARQTTLWYRDQRIALPEARPGTCGREILWRLPNDHRVTQMLKNPCYAGAFAYGRTRGATVVLNGRAQKSTRKRKLRQDWKVLLLNNHPGYISWQNYLDNEKTLERNAGMREGAGQGAPKAGPALLAGLLRCGRCGRRLSVAYSGIGGRVPRYGCCGGRENRGSASCLSIGALKVDRAVVGQVLEAIAPLAVQASMDAMDEHARRCAERRRCRELALEKARYEASRARRQYDAAEPENRLVAGELECRWNEALTVVAELEEELSQIDESLPTLTDEHRRRLLELGADVEALWGHEAAPVELKKRILRTVLHEIVIDNRDDPPEHVLRLHWQGGVHTELHVARNTTGKHRNVTDRDAVDLIRELSKICNDQTIAATLNRLGYRTGGGKTWRVHAVHHARCYYHLPNHRNSDQWLTLDQAAKELRVSVTVVRRLIAERTMPAIQVVPSAPWIIDREALSLPAVQAAVDAVRAGRKLSRPDPRQALLSLK